MRKFLLDTYHFFEKRNGLLYTLLAVTTVVLCTVASRIKIEEDVAHMLPNGKQTEQINRIFTNSGFAEKIVVKVEGKPNSTPDDLAAIADSIETKLRAQYGPYIKDIKSRVSDQTTLDVYNVVHNNLPLYLDDKDYKAIDTLLTESHIHTALENDYKALTSASGLILKRLIADDPVGISTLALKKLQTLQLDETYDLYDGYIVSKDKKNLVLFVTPSNPPIETAKNGKLIDGLEEISSSINKSGAANVYYFGGTAIAVGNARQLKRDTALTLTVTITLLLLFIGLFFRRKRVPIIMMLPVIFGGLFSLAIIAITKGSISAIAVAAGSIVLGIAINYSLHFFSHYKHCGSIEQTISDLLVPMTLGSFTTVGSFFSLIFLKSPVLNDFGLFAALSLTGATIFALVFLPHFIPVQKEVKEESHAESWFERLPALGLKQQIILVVGILGATVFLFPYAFKVGFESDMTKFNFMTGELKKAEQKMNELQGDSSKTLYVASTGSTLNEALQNNEALLAQLDTAINQGLIKKYASIGKFIPSTQLQQQKIERWNAYWTAEKKKKLLADIQKEGAAFKFTSSAFTRFDNLLNKNYAVVGIDEFEPIKNAFGSEYFVSTNGMQTIINPIKVDENMRPRLYAQLQSRPSTVILDKKIITNKFIDIIYNDFNSILAYTSLLVFFALLLSYGRLELTVITFLPMLISWIWILGIMGIFGLKFNIINIIVSTFIFGIGDDFSIFVTDGLTQKFKEGKETLASHKISIFLSAATTLIGLGALILAKHPALHSIALISIVGIGCVVFIGQTIQPFLYNFFIQNRKDKGLAPWTFPSLALSAFAFTYFVLGAIVITLTGFILLYLVPYPKLQARKNFYHILLSKFLGSLVYIMMNVRKVHINKASMDFSKPAIIIANHQSFLDILVLVMQHPKLIMLTKYWAYHSPFFGKVIQLADYYPVMEGVNPAIDKFADIVEKGYSIVIFPEGTRSPDGRITRFHKGAFYLAEKLNLDIVPILLHGTGDTMRKSDFMLFNGTMTIKYLPRITPDNESFGTGYSERTKNISRYFKKEYNNLKQELEQPIYFKQRLLMNYIYKGPLLEFSTAIKLKRAKYYAPIHQAIPVNYNITTLGCGYGFMNYMLHFLRPDNAITGIDINEEKIDTANNCYSKNEKLEFVTGNILNYNFSNNDAFIVTGLINKLSSDETKKLLTTIIEKLNHKGVVVISEIEQSKISSLIQLIKELPNISALDIACTSDIANSLIILNKP